MGEKINPKTRKIIKISIILGLIITLLSFFLPIIPCKTTETFSLCVLPNPFQNLPSALTSSFYGISNNPLTGFFLQFLIPFAIVLIISKLFRRSSDKIIDLTKTK